jgi:hypothetical protein
MAAWSSSAFRSGPEIRAVRQGPRWDTPGHGRTRQRAVGLRERLEQPIDQPGVDARAGIRDAQHRALAGRIGSDGDRGDPARGRELDRVVEQIPDHLCKARGVGLDDQRLAGEPGLEPDAMAREQRLMIVESLPRISSSR